MISYSEAYEIIKKEISSLEIPIVEVDLMDSLGRVLAEDIYSGINLPSFDNSSMDGILIKYQNDISKWKITGEISAGKFTSTDLKKAEAVWIMTGAKISEGGDTVIPIENLIIENNFAELKPDVKIQPGQNIRLTGQDLKQNELALKKNLVIKSKHIPLIASLGMKKITVIDKLRIGVFATGDELIDINAKDEKGNEDSIIASNLYSLILQINELGMECFNCGIVKDEKHLIKEKIKSSLNSGINILISTGGVSAGKYDFIYDVLLDLRAEIIFRKVNIKPGKPLLFAKILNKGKKVLIFGLPGNPVSSFVNFHLFINNILKETYFKTQNNFVKAILQSDIKKSDGKRHFIRGLVEYKSDVNKFFAEEIFNQSSSNMFGLGKSNALIIIEENRTNPKSGEEAECTMI